MHPAANSALLQTGPGSIVITEDEAIIRTAVADELSAAGFSVLQASSADEVVSILEAASMSISCSAISTCQVPWAWSGCSRRYRSGSRKFRSS